MTRADYGVAAATLLLLVLLYTLFWSESRAGFPGDGRAEAARIATADGREFTLPLDHDQILELAGPLGTTVLEIRDGAVRFLSSPCRGKLCIHAGWLRHGGEFAACLPNRISVAVVGPRTLYDSINF